MAVVFIVFILQLFTALIVVFFLSRHLNNELIKLAVEQFETIRIKGDLALIKNIVVTSGGELDQAVISRIKVIASKRFNNVSLEFSVISALNGGIVIQIGSDIIDCSIKTRLSYLWGDK